MSCLKPYLTLLARAKVKVEKKKDLCPICCEKLIKLHYMGVRHITKEKGKEGFVYSFADDLADENGSPNWCEAPSCSYGIVGLV